MCTIPWWPMSNYWVPIISDQLPISPRPMIIIRSAAYLSQTHDDQISCLWCPDQLPTCPRPMMIRSAAYLFQVHGDQISCLWCPDQLPTCPRPMMIRSAAYLFQVHGDQISCLWCPDQLPTCPRPMTKRQAIRRPKLAWAQSGVSRLPMAETASTSRPVHKSCNQT